MTLLRTSGLLLAAGLVLGAAILIAQGPLPGDVALTRGLQAVFGAQPGWAEALTATARFPAVWAVVAAAMVLAYVRGGWVAAAAVPAAFGLAFAATELWRLVIFAPRPTPGLVAVAAPSSSSGLPSTFAFYYGALGGAVLLARGRPGTGAGAWPAAAAGIAAAALIAGCAARVVLGGHWISQMAASVAFAAGLAGLAMGAVDFVAGRLAPPRR
jgi:hypothetical protein